MMKAVRLKNGTIALVKKEWNWKEQPFMKIMTENHRERIYDDFVDVELNGEISTHRVDDQYIKGPAPLESGFHHVYSTVCRKDVEFIDLL